MQCLFFISFEKCVIILSLFLFLEQIFHQFSPSIPILWIHVSSKRPYWSSVYVWLLQVEDRRRKITVRILFWLMGRRERESPLLLDYHSSNSIKHTLHEYFHILPRPSCSPPDIKSWGGIPESCSATHSKNYNSCAKKSRARFKLNFSFFQKYAATWKQ